MNIPRNTLQGRHFLPFGEAVFAVKMAEGGSNGNGLWLFAMGHTVSLQPSVSGGYLCKTHTKRGVLLNLCPRLYASIPTALSSPATRESTSASVL